MVADLLVIHKAGIRLYGFVHQRPCKLPVRTDSAGFQSFPDGGDNVFSNVSGVGSRIGEHLVILVKTLHNVQCFFCGKTIFLVGFSLKSGQVVQTGSHGLFGFFLDSGHFQTGSLGFPADFFCLFPGKSAETFCFFIPPGPFHILGFHGNAVVFLWGKLADFLFSSGDHGKGGSLHTAAGKLCIVFACQCPRCVNADKPVRLCTGNSSPVEIIVLFRIFQAGKSLTDCLVGNGRNPETLTRLLIVRLVKNPPRHQLAFTAGICRNDHLTDIFPRKLCRHSVILFSRLRNDLDLQFLRHHRQNCHIPFLILFIIVLRVF